GDELVFGFRKIEGNTIGFRKGRDHEDEKADDLRKWRRKDRPFRDKSELKSGLRIRDLPEAQRSHNQERRGEREAEREFIADHLGRTAQPAEKTVLVIGGPAAERDTVNAHGTDGENDQK